MRDAGRSGRAGYWRRNLNTAQAPGARGKFTSPQAPSFAHLPPSWSSSQIIVGSSLSWRGTISPPCQASPLWLARKGGWENEVSVRCFERFATKAVEAFGDLVDVWCTINEPSVYAVYSYLLGVWPPQKSSFPATIRVLRHQLLAHALAYRTIHRLQPAAQVGLAQHLRVFDPFRPHSALDRWAARLQDWGFNQLVLDFPAKGVLSFPLGLGMGVLYHIKAVTSRAALLK